MKRVTIVALIFAALLGPLGRADPAGATPEPMSYSILRIESIPNLAVAVDAWSRMQWGRHEDGLCVSLVREQFLGDAGTEKIETIESGCLLRPGRYRADVLAIESVAKATIPATVTHRTYRRQTVDHSWTVVRVSERSSTIDVSLRWIRPTDDDRYPVWALGILPVAEIPVVIGYSMPPYVGVCPQCGTGAGISKPAAVVGSIRFDSAGKLAMPRPFFDTARIAVGYHTGRIGP